MQMQTEAGMVKLEVLYGQDATDRHWGSPIREHWGLTSHQQLSLALEDKLAFTITATASYEEAAALAQKWGVAVTDSLLHSLTQRLGFRAETQKEQRLKTPPVEAEPKRAPAKLGVLMLDGWQGERGFCISTNPSKADGPATKDADGAWQPSVLEEREYAENLIAEEAENRLTPLNAA